MGSRNGLESEFLEEPLVLAALVSFLERSLEGSLALSLSGGVLKISLEGKFPKLFDDFVKNTLQWHLSNSTSMIRCEQPIFIVCPV